MKTRKIQILYTLRGQCTTSAFPNNELLRRFEDKRSYVRQIKNLIVSFRSR